MNRRRFLGTLAMTAAATTGGCRVFNPCLTVALPEPLAGDELIQAAWEDIAPERFWDCHVHLLGTGDSGSGAWMNPRMRSLLHPSQYARLRFFLNAACVADREAIDDGYLHRLLACHRALRPGVRLMLLAFDYTYTEDGRRSEARSAFHVPNRYARLSAERHSGQAEWIASVHPYREDAVEAVRRATSKGARAVKWLPNAMGIDPASARCDRFYAALAALRLPLLSHTGEERAVAGAEAQELGNPLRLRRALDHGVKVIAAHCASLGTGVDIDKGSDGPRVPNIELFARLMDDHRYEQLLYGDISALTQRNRLGAALDMILDRDDWHARLINGSDYPLPGVVALFSVAEMAQRGYIPAASITTLEALQFHNALLFDFVLKRSVRRGAKRLSAQIFDTRRVFVSS